MDTYIYFMVAIFVVGYLMITLEHVIHIDKATTAILMGISCWTIQFIATPSSCATSEACLSKHLADISQIIFFLLGALGIVEVINAHRGFAIVSKHIPIGSKKALLWTLSLITFFLSAILDNLTTTIVMTTLLQKLVDSSEDRLLIGGSIVVAANAGGAWTPIGDVTTTMLWIGGQLSSDVIIRNLFLPSIATLLVSCFLLSWKLKGNFSQKTLNSQQKVEPFGALVFFLGISALIFVPIFKTLTGLPPFMGVLLGFSVLWLITDLVHRKSKRDHLRVPAVLSKIDFSSLLFFLGILLAVDAMEAASILDGLASWLNKNANLTAVPILIGLASAVVDNVPLVAASMGMYHLEQIQQNHSFWQLVAFCAGTGGSILIIGSAAGVVYMGLEKVNFIWYLKRISLAALASYFVGIAVYLVF